MSARYGGFALRGFLYEEDWRIRNRRMGRHIPYVGICCTVSSSMTSLERATGSLGFIFAIARLKTGSIVPRNRHACGGQLVCPLRQYG